MKYSKQEISKELRVWTERDDGYAFYFWEEMPTTKAWFDENTYSFVSDVGVSISFENYTIDELIYCLDDLHDKIVTEYEKKGIKLHDRYPSELYPRK